MSFNVDTFRQKGLVHGGARPTLFEVALTFPAIVPNGTAAAEQARFVCRATSLPASRVDKIDVPYMGRKIVVDGDRTFDDWQIQVMNDNDFFIKSAFEAWLNGINSHRSNRRHPSLTVTEGANSLKTTATVYQLARNGNGGADVEQHLRAYRFVGVMPTQVDPIQLDWEMTNQIEVFAVNLAYDYWEPIVGRGPGASAVPYETEMNPA